jgi:hypothetical protein
MELAHLVGIFLAFIVFFAPYPTEDHAIDELFENK